MICDSLLNKFNLLSLLFLRRNKAKNITQDLNFLQSQRNKLQHATAQNIYHFVNIRKNKNIYSNHPDLKNMNFFKHNTMFSF